MSKLGDFRLNTYELLYREPLSRYRKHSVLKVLILGTPENDAEAFKAVLWAGQLNDDTTLDITVALDPDEIDMFRTSLHRSMPYLQSFCDLYSIGIHVIESSLAVMKTTVDEVFGSPWYDYMIFCNENSGKNREIAENMVKYLNNYYSSTPSEDLRCLLAVLNDEDATYTHKLLQQDTPSMKYRTIPFGTTMEYTGVSQKETLLRYAANINFVYDRMGDPNQNYDRSVSAFTEQFRDQFEKEPVARNAGSPASYFLGKNYSTDSSLAAAVHIPYKMASISLLDPSVKDPEAALMKAIDKKDELYDELCVLEHRRWFAYMVTRGYRPHKDVEELRNIVTASNSNKDHANLIHICMVDADQGIYLSRIPRAEYRSLMQKVSKNYDAYLPDLSELDKVSLAHYSAINFKAVGTNRVTPDAFINRFPFLHQFRYLTDCVRAICTAPGSGPLNDYSSELNALKIIYSKNQSVLDNLNRLDQDDHMKLMKLRCNNTDFLAIDGQIIDMIPFITWYGEKYGTVITVSNGNLAEDIAIPTMLTAKTAIFVGEHVTDPDYMDRAKNYFIHNGSNTTPLFRKVVISNTPALVTALTGIVGDYKYKDLVFNLVKHNKSEVPMAIGVLAQHFPVVQYHPIVGIMNFMTNAPFCSGLANRSLTVKEYMSLCGSYIPLSADVSLPDKAYTFLKDLFWNEFNGYWSQITKVFVKSSKGGYSPKLLGASGQEIALTSVSLEVRSNLYYESGMMNVMVNLESSHMIRNFSVTEDAWNNTVILTFETIDQGIIDYLSLYAIPSNAAQGAPVPKYPAYGSLSNARHNLLSFDPQFGIMESSLETKRAEYATSETPAYQKDRVEKFLNALAEQKLIRNLKYGSCIVENPKKAVEQITSYYVSFYFLSDAVKRLLSKEGNMFEYITFREFKECGKFDDIQTGVAFDWENNYTKGFNKAMLLLEKEASESATGLITHQRYRDIVHSCTRSNTPTDVKNEIDVIAMNGMRPVFVSCKDRYELSSAKEWMYEINSVADQYHAASVLALHYDLESNWREILAALNRGKAMEISVIGSEIMKVTPYSNQLTPVLKGISRGETYSVLDHIDTE